MKKLLVGSIITFWGLFFATGLSTAATSLDIRDGQLYGAKNVDVHGTFYDVTFADGTLVELYGEADENSDFVFAASGDLNTAAQLAYDASQALLDQVLIGIYDTTASLTYGIYNPHPLAQGSIVTPFWLLNPGSVGVRVAINGPGIADVVASGSQPPNFDTAWWGKNPVIGEDADATVIAVWSLATPVPIPGTGLVLGMGLVVLAGLRTRRK